MLKHGQSRLPVDEVHSWPFMWRPDETVEPGYMVMWLELWSAMEIKRGYRRHDLHGGLTGGGGWLNIRVTCLILVRCSGYFEHYLLV